MQIEDHDLQELMGIYKQEFGKELSKAEALEMATRLLDLYLLLSRPLSPSTGPTRPDAR